MEVIETKDGTVYKDSMEVEIITKETSEAIRDLLKAKNKQIQAQQQEIWQARQERDSQQRIAISEMEKVKALTADKDEQAQIIMRMDTDAKQAAEILNDMCDVAIARGMAYLYAKDANRVRKVANALLGGAEDAENTQT